MHAKKVVVQGAATPQNGWEVCVCVSESFLKPVSRALLACKGKFFTSEECENVLQHWAVAWRLEGAWRIEETKCI